MNKEGQEPLKDMDRRFEAIFEAAIDGIITIDAKGTIESVNPAAAKLFGYAEAEMLGRNIAIIMPEPHRSAHDGYLDNYLRTGIKRIIGIGREVNGMRKDGSTFPFRLSISEVKMRGEERIFTGIVHDISEQKAAEEKILRMNQELERMVEARTEELAEAINKLLQINHQLKHQIHERQLAERALRKSEEELLIALSKEKELNELKSRFVSMASHEFRTPLSTVLSSTALIARYAEGEQQAQRLKHITRIKSAVEHLNGILNDFLSLSRIEEGKMQVDIRDVHLPTLCRELLNDVEGLLKPGQHVELELPEGLPKHLRSDDKLLRNILINLLSNAIKYSPEGRPITLRAEQEGQHLRLSVRDRGIGIPDDDKRNLFSRFFRASNATNIQGTGLGLNIVKRYADLLGGYVTCDSQLGEGSTFTFVLPMEALDG